jgi:hypothetical protein
MSLSSKREKDSELETMAKGTVIACRCFVIIFISSLSALHLIPKPGNFISPTSTKATADHKLVRAVSPQPKIKTINLIGERHSGTKWITSHLKDCFGDQVKVLNRYTRYKHWFQYEDTKLYTSNSTVVVALVRNPYDWLESMRKKPYHSPNHFDLDWETFVTKPWGMERGNADKKLIQDGLTHNTTCIHRFPFENIIPCSKLDRNMYNGTQRSGKNIGVNYELNQDGSGNAYGSILQLRSDKIRNFLNVSSFDAVHAFYPVQFEFMVTQGTSELIDELEKVTGFKARCHRVTPHLLQEREYDSSFIQWVNDNLDWDTEELIGYSQRAAPYLG